MADDDDALLAGLEGDDRTERQELLAYLRTEHDASDEELERAHADGTLLLMAAGRALGTLEQYSVHEVCQRARIPVELWTALGRANGRSVPADHDRPFYGEVDLQSAETARRFLDAGIDQAQLVSTARVLARGLSQAAELMRQTVMQLSLSPGQSERELAERYAGVASGLTPLVGPLVDQMLRIHLAQAVRDEVVTTTERHAGELPGARQVTVAFADLVGFTRLGAQLPPDELEAVAERLTAMTFERIEPPVRFVKAVGDAVLLVCPEPVPLLELAQDLVDAAGAEGEEYPQLRVGVASGPAVSRAGDWFGAPVNLASRITSIARAGSVVCDQATRTAVDDHDALGFSTIGERKVKGVPGTVRLSRVRGAD